MRQSTVSRLTAGMVALMGALTMLLFFAATNARIHAQNLAVDRETGSRRLHSCPDIF